MPLALTASQLALLDATAAKLDDALVGGVVDGAGNVIVPATQGYADMTEEAKKATRDFARVALAALVSALPLPATRVTGAVQLAAVTGGGINGSIVVEGGLITIHYPPT